MATGLSITNEPSRFSDEDREREIVELVDRFYGRVRDDDVLGPIFDANVDDWTEHLETMQRFWSSAIYRTGRYSGRPLDIHRAIPEIRENHFPRWLSLWQETVDDIVTSDARTPLKALAARMADTMQSRLNDPRITPIE